MFKKMLILSSVILPTYLYAAPTNDFYTGIKVNKRSLGFKENYGSKFFSKNLKQYGVFAGIGFLDHFALEAEIFSTKKQKSKTAIYESQTEFGNPDYTGINDSESYDVNNKISGNTIQLRAHYPIMNNFKIFATAGLSYLKLKINANITSINGMPPTPRELEQYSFSAKKNKIVPKFSVGADWKLTKHLGVRADIAVENTNNMVMYFKTPQPGSSILTAKPKKSYIYSLALCLVL